MQELVCILLISCMWLCGPQKADLTQTWVSSSKGPWKSRSPVEMGRGEGGSGMLWNNPVSQHGEESLPVAGEPSRLRGRRLDLGDVSTSGSHREGSAGQVLG